jgi:hypothetical protein
MSEQTGTSFKERSEAGRSTPSTDRCDVCRGQKGKSDHPGIGYKLFTAGLISSMAMNEMQRVYRLLKGAPEEGKIPWHWIVNETRLRRRARSHVPRGPGRTEVSLPRQSRGLYGVSRSKRLYGVAHATPQLWIGAHLCCQLFHCPADGGLALKASTLVCTSVQYHSRFAFSRRADLLRLAARGADASAEDERRKCQTVTATPAEPGELPRY